LAAARTLDIAAAERGWPAAMYRLIVDFLADSPEEAETWQRRLLDTSNTYWIGEAVNATTAADPGQARKWASLVAESENLDAIEAVAAALESVDEELAKSLRERLPEAS
jgi:hypothetical protein